VKAKMTKNSKECGVMVELKWDAVEGLNSRRAGRPRQISGQAGQASSIMRVD